MADRRHPTRRERGIALLAVLIALAVLVPLGGFAVLQARLDFLVQHHGRAASETFAVAESGLEHALAELRRDPRFERLRLGPDRRAGTADDGEFPFVTAPPAHFPAAPFRYEVRVVATAADRVELVARGFGPLGAVRGVAAAVVRDAAPYLPAALASAGAALALDLGDGWQIDGAAAAAGRTGVPAMAVRDDAAAARIAAALDEGARQRLRGPGGPPSLAAAAMPDLAGLFDAAARLPDVRPLAAETSGSLGDGLFVAPAGARLRDVTGSGILLVDGPLDLSGEIAFAGLIACAGDLRADRDARVAVDGALLQGPAGSIVALAGSGRVRYDGRVAERLAATWPGLLPQLARVVGWRELADAGAP